MQLFPMRPRGKEGINNPLSTTRKMPTYSTPSTKVFNFSFNVKRCLYRNGGECCEKMHYGLRGRHPAPPRAGAWRFSDGSPIGCMRLRNACGESRDKGVARCRQGARTVPPVAHAREIARPSLSSPSPSAPLSHRAATRPLACGAGQTIYVRLHWRACPRKRVARWHALSRNDGRNDGRNGQASGDGA